MPIEVKLSPSLQSNDWLNAPYREGYSTVSSGKKPSAHPNNTAIKTIPGLTNGQKILQNLACSNIDLLHPAWVTNRRLLEERISASIHDINEIIVENILVKITNEGAVYILQLSIDLTVRASIKLNRFDAISASFILNQSLNLQKILPLVICSEQSLYIGINEPENNNDNPSIATNLKKLMFNLSHSNQSNNLSHLVKNRRLLEERISTSIHDITMISIEKVSIENTDEGEIQLIELSIEINQTHSIIAHFVLTTDFNLERQYMCKSQLLTNQQFHTYQPKMSTAVIKDEQPIRTDAAPNPNLSAQKENIKQSERTKNPYITAAAALELPDYDKVLSGQETPAAVQAQQHDIEWIQRKQQTLKAPVAIRPVAALIELPSTNPSNQNSNSSVPINNSQQYGTTPAAYSSKKP